MEFRPSAHTQVLLTAVSKRKERDIAVRIATYREALGCITLALPPSCLQPHAFVGELLLHSDDDLAAMASRVIQIFATDQPVSRVARTALKASSKPPRAFLEPSSKLPGAASLTPPPRRGLPSHTGAPQGASALLRQDAHPRHLRARRVSDAAQGQD